MNIVLIIAAVISAAVSIYTERNGILLRMIAHEAIRDPVLRTEDWNFRDLRSIVFGKSFVRLKWTNWLAQVVLIGLFWWRFGWLYTIIPMVVFFFLCNRAARYIIKTVGMAESMRFVVKDMGALLKANPESTLCQRIHLIANRLAIGGSAGS